MTFSPVVGRRRVNRDRESRPRNRLAGVLPVVGWLVDWYVSKKLPIRCWTDSWLPLPLVFEGLNHSFSQSDACHMIGSYSYVFNTVHLWEVYKLFTANCGPLSPTQWTGNPYFAKNSRKMVIAALAVVFRAIKKISGQRECASTIMK